MQTVIHQNLFMISICKIHLELYLLNLPPYHVITMPLLYEWTAWIAMLLYALNGTQRLFICRQMLFIWEGQSFTSSSIITPICEMPFMDLPPIGPMFGLLHSTLHCFPDTVAS